MPGAVRGEDDAPGVEHHNLLVERVEYRLDQRLAGLQGLFRFLALADIALHADKLGQYIGAVENWRDREVVPERRAVLAVIQDFAMEGFAGIQPRAHPGQRFLARIGALQQFAGAPDDVAGDIAGDALEGFAGVGDAPVRPGNQDALRDRGECVFPRAQGFQAGPQGIMGQLLIGDVAEHAAAAQLATAVREDGGNNFDREQAAVLPATTQFAPERAAAGALFERRRQAWIGNVHDAGAAKRAQFIHAVAEHAQGFRVRGFDAAVWPGEDDCFAAGLEHQPEAFLGFASGGFRCADRAHHAVDGLSQLADLVGAGPGDRQ